MSVEDAIRKLVEETVAEERREGILELIDTEENGDDYSDWSVPELAGETDERGLDVEGTGQGGRKLKSDYIEALRKDDEGSQ